VNETWLAISLQSWEPQKGGCRRNLLLGAGSRLNRKNRSSGRHLEELRHNRTKYETGRSLVFKTAALNHSATLPCSKHQIVSDISIENSVATSGSMDPSWTQQIHYPFLPSTPLARAPITAAALVSAFLVRLA
jgi:hypothetical protein